MRLSPSLPSTSLMLPKSTALFDSLFYLFLTQDTQDKQDTHTHTRACARGILTPGQGRREDKGWGFLLLLLLPLAGFHWSFLALQLVHIANCCFWWPPFLLFVPSSFLCVGLLDVGVFFFFVCVCVCVCKAKPTLPDEEKARRGWQERKRETRFLVTSLCRIANVIARNLQIW